MVAEVNINLLITQEKEKAWKRTFAVAFQKVFYFSTVAGCAFSPECDNPNYSFICDGKESVYDAGDLGLIPGL